MSYVPRILIIDDELRMRDSLEFLLRSQGYKTQTGSSGKEALEYLARDNFDLVLLDIVMPDMSGHQVMDYINDQGIDTLVITMTGHASVDSAVESLRKGAYDYLRKPFDFEQLLKRVKNALDQSRLKREHSFVSGKLALTERQYQYLVNASPDIIYTLDSEGKFTFINGVVESLLGYRSQQLVGKHYTFIVFEDDIDKAKYHFNERRTGTRATTGVELRLKSPGNGSDSEKCLVIELKAMGMYDKPVDQPDKNFLGTHGVARDIGERKRLEAQLLQARKMEAIGTLAGGIAHDFNNLLMGIQGRVSLMSLDIDVGHPHFEHLKGIEDMVKRGSYLTKQLLGFAMGGKYQVQPTDLNEVIERCSEVFGRTKKECSIYKKYQKDIWTVEADRGQIEQVLLNLYVNAWQAMPGGGEIYIQTENVTLDEAEGRLLGVAPGDYVKMSVTDTGVGMDEETQRHIFEPFFTTREIGKGTGLGLASVYGIVKNHEGAINVYSRKGEGSTFSIYLPAVKAPIREQRIREEREEIQRGSETVLLIDDEDMIINIGREMLEKMGYEVLVAGSSKEAIETYKSHQDKIALVILDMIMPDMSGGDVYDALKKINWDVRVLLSSGYSIRGQATEILKRGCNGFIQKPFNMGELSQKIRKILDRLSPEG